MPIPNATTAHVPPEKLTDYLLNTVHPVGGSKATWFIGLGYDLGNPTELGADLLGVVQTSDVFEEKASPFGTKFVVGGKITTPSGQVANVVTVWIVEPPDDRPRLVTAYPGEKT